MAMLLELPSLLLRRQQRCREQHRHSVASLAAAAGGTVTQQEPRELLWAEPSRWREENGPDKWSSRYPDFRHSASNAQHSTGPASAPAAWDAPSLTAWVTRRCGEGQLSQVLDLLQQQQQHPGSHLSRSVLYLVLKKCMAHKDLKSARRLHALVVNCGYESDVFLTNHIIAMYASLGKLEDAVHAFDKVSIPDVYMWSSMILAHARHGQPRHAVTLYEKMRQSSLKPDNHVFVAVLKACALAENLVSGKLVHADIQASAAKADVFVGTSLVDMYAKCGSLEDARQVFDCLPTRNVATWNAMIAGYGRQGLGLQALALYDRMHQEGLAPADYVTFVCLVQACSSVGALQQGKQLHCQVRQRGFQDDAVMANCLVTMYVRCGSLEDARTVFDSLPVKDVVTWTAMITGYTEQGLARQALGLYASMQQEGTTLPDQLTFVCLLQACASAGALHQGKHLHGRIHQAGLESNVVIGSCLVDMYSKCGSLEDARKVFDRLPTKNLVTWTAMLNGYAEYGDGRMAILCFQDMLEQGMQPDGTIFLCLFVACSRAGLVHEGQCYFRMMIEDHGILPTDSHFSCIVDLLGRSGHLDEAECFLHTMSFEKDISAWKALLSACKNYGDVERGRRCFDRLVELEPDNASSYVLLGNIYANAGRWAEVDRIESLRKSAGALKKPAKATIEVRNEVHEFTVGEERSDILSKLRSVNTRFTEEGGHVPQTELVLKAVSELEKEDALCGHAEKLALAYGLLNTPDGTTLLVTKNLRMCNDCHSSTKVMSRLEQRQIIVRDAHQVHRFLDGFCSCGDRH